MLVDHLHLDSSNWTIKQLAYNGQGPFRNASDLQAAFDCGFICADCLPVRQCRVCSHADALAAGCRLLSKISIQAPKNSTPEKPLFSSMRRRGPIRYLDERPIPPIAPPPAGQRFAVKGNQASCSLIPYAFPPCYYTVWHFLPSSLMVEGCCLGALAQLGLPYRTHYPGRHLLQRHSLPQSDHSLRAGTAGTMLHLFLA
jgi:hypothetical protein